MKMNRDWLLIISSFQVLVEDQRWLIEVLETTIHFMRRGYLQGNAGNELYASYIAAKNDLGAEWVDPRGTNKQ